MFKLKKKKKLQPVETLTEMFLKVLTLEKENQENS